MSSTAQERERQARLGRHLYWTSFLVAALLSIWLGRDPQADVLPAIVASAVMLLYLLASRILTPLAMQHEDFADGFYYLGFLLTLVALVATLISLGGTPPGPAAEAGTPPDGVAPEDIQRLVLARFGLALSTTIVGLAVRTALRMFHDTSEQNTRDALVRAQEDLRRASENFRGVLQNAATDMGTTLGESVGRIDQSVGMLVGRLDKVRDEVGRLEDRLGPLAETFELADEGATDFAASIDSLREKSQSLDHSFEGLETDLQTFRTSLTSGADGLGSFTKSTHQAAEASGKLEQISQTLSQSLSGLRETLRGIEDLPDLGAELETLSRSINGSRAPIERFGGSLRDLESALEGIRQQTDGISFQGLSRLTTAIGGASESIAGDLQRWQTATNRLSELAETLTEREREAAEALLNVERELSSGVSFLRQMAAGDD